ncbi:Ig-like domain-containing protein, partial [Acinetobacter sp. P8-3-8]|uniref:Ig-like domain-containing protein n=1 Tax=Acinetobacter sp. P8-3-8 TaxID=1029823 RepID=UPI0014874380
MSDVKLLDDVGAVTGAIEDGTSTDDTRPEFTGQATPDVDYVNVYDNGGLIGTATVQPDGTWSFTPELPLIGGDHSFTGKPVDAVGNEGQATDPIDFNVIGSAPLAPTIQTVSDNVGDITGPLQKGATTDDKTPTVSGTAQPGTTVHVYSNGTEVGSVAVKPDGTWTLDVADLGADGEKKLTAVAVDPAGQESPATGEYPIILDSTAPNQPADITATDDVGPTIGEISAGGTTDDTTPTITGTGEPGATVEVIDNGQPLGTTTVDSAGNWTFTPDTPLTDGPHEITTTQTDPAGNTSEPSAPLDFTVDTSTSDVQITHFIDNTAPLEGNVAKAGETNDTTPTMVGISKANATISITDENGQVVGTAITDATGQWSVELSPQTEGEHTYTATAQLPNGNTATDTAQLTIDTTAPIAATIATVTDDVGENQGTLDSGDTTDDTTPTITGTAEPNNIVTIYADGKPVGSVVADPNGNWNYTIPSPGLTEGPHDLTVTQTDPAGNESTPSAPFEVIVDTTAPTITAEITGITEDTGVADDYTTNDTSLVIHGKVSDATQLQTGDTVQVRVDGGAWKDATLNADGTWSLDNTATPLAEGKHTVEARVVDQAGNATAATSKEITIDTTGPVDGSLSDVKLLDDVGAVTGAIEDGTSTDDTRPEFTGQATPDVDYVNVYDNGGLIGTATVQPDGTWSFTPENPLTSGPHEFSAKPVDNAGNEGNSTDSISFNLIGEPPQEPAITQVQDDFGPEVGDLQKGQSTDDKTPTVSGTGQAGSVVHVFVDGTEVGSTTVNPDKTWSITLPDLGADGEKKITANATDGAGQVSTTTDIYPIVLDTAAPTNLGFTANDDVGSQTGPISNGDTTDDTIPTLTGTGVPGDIVTVYDNGVPIGSVAVESSGDWTFVPSPELAEGSHELQITHTDAAGNESGLNDPLDFTVDTGIPTVKIESVTDNVGITETIAKNGLTNDNTPTLTGTATPNQLVTITDKVGTPIASVTADATGKWSVDLPQQTDGAHDYVATVTLPNGETATDNFALNIDTQAPSKPAFEANDDVGPDQSVLHSGDTTDDATPALTGTGQAGDKVTIYDNGQAIGTTTIKPDGTWAYTPTTPLAEGSHSLEVTHTDPAGNESAKSDPLDIQVDTSTVEITIDGIEDDQLPVIETIAKGGVTNDDTPTIFGTTKPDSLVTIYDSNGQAIGSTIADSSGQWSVTLPTQPEGHREYTAVAELPSGQTAEAKVDFTIDTTAPTQPSFVATDNVAPSVGDIESGDTTDDTTPTLTGMGQAGDTVTIYDNGQSLGTTTVKPDGTWTYTPTTPLTEGPHSLEVTQTDPAGNESDKSEPLDFTVSTAVATVNIETATDNQTPKTGPISDGGLTNDGTPILSGTATANQVVIIKDQTDTVVGSVTASATGQWSIELPQQADGEHTYTAFVTLANGSTAQSQYSLEIDATTPAQVTIDSVSDDVGVVQGLLASGDSTDDKTPTLQGAAEAGNVVTIYDQGKPVGSVIADPNGHWNYTIPAPGLTEGSHNLTVTQTDTAGNVSLPSSPFNVVVDITAPTITAEITGITEDTGLANDFLTNDPSLVISGKVSDATQLQAGDKVQVRIDGGVWKDATLNADGTWSLDNTANVLADGKHTIDARVIDKAGNYTAPSTKEVMIDTVAPST